MTDAREIRVEELLRRVRESLRRRHGSDNGPIPEEAVPPVDPERLAADLAYLRSIADIEKVAFISHRPLSGRLVVGLKTVLRRLLTPILEQQAAFNATAIRVTTQLGDWMEALERRQAEALALESRLCEELAAAQVRLDELAAQLRKSTPSDAERS